MKLEMSVPELVEIFKKFRYFCQKHVICPVYNGHREVANEMDRDITGAPEDAI